MHKQVIATATAIALGIATTAIGTTAFARGGGGHSGGGHGGGGHGFGHAMGRGGFSGHRVAIIAAVSATVVWMAVVSVEAFMRTAATIAIRTITRRAAMGISWSDAKSKLLHTDFDLD